MKKDWTFYILTFGCKVNQCESRLIHEAWQKAGGKTAQAPENADYIIINSCAITSRAEQDMRHAVFMARKKNPFAIIIVSGCGAQFYKQFVPRKNANYASANYYVPQRLKHLLYNGPKILQDLDWSGNNTEYQPILTSYDRARPIIKIQDGCSRFCAYCIVPHTRGAPRSRSYEDIIEECALLRKRGYGELVISGINLMQYGREGDFWTLMEKLDRELYENFGRTVRLRISSIDAGMLNPESIEILRKSKLICKHLHLSIQHASANILSAMRRDSYRAETVSQNISRLGDIWGNFGLGADFLIGFPGETQADLEILAEFIENLPFTYGHVFPYSARPGTIAEKMPCQVPKREKESRAARIRDIINQKKNWFWQRQCLVPEMEIVIYKENSGKIRGLNEYYVPCVLEDAHATRELRHVRPVGISQDGLKVAPVETQEKTAFMSLS